MAALIRDYDPVHDVFRCHRTHVALEENDPKSPKYLTFDHSEPGVETPENLFLTMAVLNESKTDMTWPEYVAFAREIVRANDTGEFDEKVLEFKHWYRLVRRGRKGRGRKALGKNARGKRARGKKR